MFAPHCFGWLIQVLVERGRIDEARALLAEAGADGAVAETYATAPLLRARAVLRLGEGADASAADALAYGRALEAVGMRNPAAGPWRSDAALALLNSGKVEEARPLAATEVELARCWGAPRAVGRALRVHGLAEGGEAGIATLRESVLALEDSPALLERAPHRGVGRRGHDEPPDRRVAVRNATDGRDAPQQRLPEAPDRLADPARGGARGIGGPRAETATLTEKYLVQCT